MSRGNNEIADRWLAVLNGDPCRTTCYSPGGRQTLGALQRQIARRQSVVAESGLQKWILTDPDPFSFLCSLFALLTQGCEVLIPPNSVYGTVDLLRSDDVGMMEDVLDGFDRKEAGMPVDGPIDGSTGDSIRISVSPAWGRVAFFSSGSSGQPKRISKTPDQLLLEAELLAGKWMETPGTMIVSSVTHLHVYGLAFSLLAPLVGGRPFYSANGNNLLSLLSALDVQGDDSVKQCIVVASPSIGRRKSEIETLAVAGSIASSERSLPVCRVFSAGGFLSGRNAADIMDLFDSPLTEIFGSTETGAVAFREHAKPPVSATGAGWRLLDGIELAVNQGVRERADEDPLCGSLSVWGGHAGGSERSPVHTGDAVRVDPDGRFQLLGRNDDVRKIEGKRVSLRQVGDLLQECAFVREAVVIPGRSGEKEILIAGVELSRAGMAHYADFGKPSTDGAIRAHLLRSMEPVLVPRRIRYLENMPYNSMGKIPREKLSGLLESGNPVTEPEFFLESQGENELGFSMNIPVNLRWFQGHFSRRPIVPGVVLLHWVRILAEKYWNHHIDTGHVEKLKFSSPVGPGEVLQLSISRKGQRVSFVYTGNGGRKIASGFLRISPNERNE